MKSLTIEVGRKAPDFSLLDTDRKPRSLRELIARKTVLAFFPGAFTGVCTRELCTFRDRLGKLEEYGAKVVAISVDSPFSNKGFSEKNGLTFPILSDYDRNTIRAYDIVLKDFAGMRGYEAAKRSVFLLDKDGVVKYKWVSDDPGKEPNYEEIIQALSKIG